MQRWRVLLINGDGGAVDGHFDHVGGDLPPVGEVIDVRNRRDRGSAVIRARVSRVDPGNPLPIAAVQLWD